MPTRGLRICSLGLAVIATALPAQTPPQFRFTKDLIPTQAGPVLGLADFDQDGDLDLLTNGTGIYLNDGNGTFTPHPVLSPVVAIPYTAVNVVSTATSTPVFAIGDLNGDGYPDVLASAYGGTSYSIVTTYQWMNLGNGALSPTSLPTFGSGPGSSYSYAIRAIALGDVDLDGDLDAVVSRTITNVSQPAPMLLWLNNGAGVFTNVATSFPAHSPHQIALADFDADGDLDLMTLDFFALVWGPNPPQIFFNYAGVFAGTGTVIPVPGAYDTFAIGNLDSDGIPDLVLDNSPTWAPTVVCPPTSAAAPLLLVNGGTGTFSAMSSSIASPVVRGIPRILDLDGDGQQDLLRITPVGAEVYRVASSTAFGLSLLAPIYAFSDYAGSFGGLDAAAGDLDGDGDRDVVVSTAQGNQVLFNDSVLTPVAVGSTLAARSLPGNFGSGDVEGDGDQDLMVGFVDCGAGTTRLVVATNDGTGSLVEGLSLPCPNCPVATQIGPRLFFDADGDGDLDAYVVEVANPPNPAIPIHRLLINNGGTLAVAQMFTPTNNWVTTKSLRRADLDGDGDLDIVASMSSAGGGCMVLFNSGGSYQSGPVFGGDTDDFELADLDGDGDLDLARTGNFVAGVWLNGGSGGFIPSPGAFLPALPPPPPVRSIESGDLDGDGDVDLLLGNAIYLNSGTATFTAAGTGPLANWPQTGSDIRLADVDGDGDLDILDPRGTLHRNLGAAVVWTTEALPRPLAFPSLLADFDGDQDLDLVTQGPAVLTNMTRQLSRKVPARPGRPASLEIGSAPGTVWALHASTGTGNLNVPPIGIVRLDLANLHLVATGVIPSSGLSVIGGITPTVPGIVGFTLYWQAVMFEAFGPRVTGLEVTTVAAY